MSDDELKELEPKARKRKNNDAEAIENTGETTIKEKTVEERLIDLEKENSELNKRLKELEKGTFKPGQTRHLHENEFVSLHHNLDSLTKVT